MAASTLYTESRSRRAATAQEAAAEASRLASEETTRAQEKLRKTADTVRDVITSRIFEIPSNAFNASSEFTNILAVTEIIGIALATKTGNQLKEIGMHLGDIRDELGAHTTAMVQRWQTRGFGAFIYEFLRTEIDDYGGEESVGHHAFYVFNPTTSADVVFKQMVRDHPLPASFGGFSSDIEAIFLLMWSNRQTLRRTMGREAAENIQFHLLIPARKTMAIFDRMAIEEGIGKLIIKGHQDEGNCYVWLNFVRMPRQVELRGIRNLNTDRAELKNLTMRFDWSLNTGAAFWVGAVACPPAAFLCGLGFVGCCVSGMAHAAVGVVSPALRSEPRILGLPGNRGDENYG